MCGQNIIKVIEGDTSKMIFEKGEWFFKENLPDGHYISYRNIASLFAAKEIFIKEGKKNGMESRYFILSDKKYAEINWENGEKNGLEVQYNVNGTIGYLLTFKNDILDGNCIVNWSEGEKRYKGFYKNGFRDSIWTYYDHVKNRSDTSNYWLSEEYKYQNGRPILISAWNKNGAQIVINGKGMLIDIDYYTTATEYNNGLKNGKQVTKTQDGFIYNERYYLDGQLIKETIYYDSIKVASISEWSYPFPPKIDTNRVWIDDSWLTGIFYNKIDYSYTSVRTGNWVSYYSDGTKIYEGVYLNGNKTGVWRWNFPNGKEKVIANFSKNKWEHFDTTGNLISSLKDEYLTILTNDTWYLNQPLDTSVVTLTAERSANGRLQLNFQPSGLVDFDCWECERTTNKFSLSVDTISLYIYNEEINYQRTLKYQITSANEYKIIMKRID